MQADLEKESFKQTEKKLSPKKGNKNLKKATKSYQKFKYFRSITEGKREILSFSEKKWVLLIRRAVSHLKRRMQYLSM